MKHIKFLSTLSFLTALLITGCNADKNNDSPINHNSGITESVEELDQVVQGKNLKSLTRSSTLDGIEYSRTFLQAYERSTESGIVHRLRFATAVLMTSDVDTIDIKLEVPGEETRTKKVSTVYHGLIQGDKTYYYSPSNPDELVTVDTSSNYYFAVYQIDIKTDISWLAKEVKCYTKVNGGDANKYVQASYENATSSDYGTCCEVVKQGDVEVGVKYYKEHAWDSGVITVGPTCHSKGEKIYTCERCGKTKIEELEMTEHDFDTAWSTDDNYHWHKCLNDGCTEVKDKAVHTYGEVQVTKPATCTEAGEGYKECACGKKVSVTIPAGHESMEFVAETIPTHEKAGTLAHYYCDDCKGYFEDKDGLLPIADPTTLEIDSPVIKKDLKYTNLGTFDIVDQKAGTGEKHKDGSGGYAAWFNINDDQGKGAVYVEANVKLTKNAAYSDIGFMIGTTGSGAIDRVVRSSLYVPDPSNGLATAVRIRTETSAPADQTEKQTALPSSINVAADFVKIAMYRKGSNVVFFVNGEIATGMNMNWKCWAKAADETVAYKYGIFGQNISDMFYSGAKFEYGDAATALYEGLAMNKIMPDTRTGSYGAYKYARGNKVWNDTTKTSTEAPFLTSGAQQVENTYVEGTFKAKVNSNDTFASFGFMMTLANGTNNKANIVVRPVLYVNNGDGLISGLKIKQVDTANGNADVDKFSKGGVLSYGSLAEGVKFAMYRAGTTIKLYINDQEVFSQDKDWVGSALALGNAEQKMIYSIWQQNMTDTEASNLKILTGEDADAAVAGLKTTGALDMASKFGQYSVVNAYYNGGVVNVNTAKMGVFDRRIIKSSVYFEASFKFSTMKAWSQVGIEFVQTHSKDGKTEYTGANAERLSVGLKHNVNDTEGTLTRLVAKANPITGAAASDQTVKDGLGFAKNTEVKLAVYRNNEKVYAVINDTTVYEIASSIYSSVWTDFTDAEVGYNLGVYYDGSTAPTGTFSKISMITGAAADAKIQSLLPKE